MSGHSKWSKIKHKKGAADASRGKLFAKLGKEIFVAARNGEPDPDNNAGLRLAIDKAKAQSMPKDNINRAIDRAKGSVGGANFEEIVYEGYGPSGVAIMCYCLSDNRNRIASFVKSIFPKRGGNLGSDGSVSYLFSRKGIIVIDKENVIGDINDFMMSVLELDIDDMIDDMEIVIYTSSENFISVKGDIDDFGSVSEYTKAEISMVPSMTIELDQSDAEKVLGLIEALEENDDIQDVYHNLA